MELTEEQTAAMFTAEVPDVSICLHEMRVQPVNVEIDGETIVGYVARLVGHGADGKPLTIDFATNEPVLQETMTRFIEAGMTAAFLRAAQSNDPDSAIGMLIDLSVFMADDETPETEPETKEIGK